MSPPGTSPRAGAPACARSSPSRSVLGTSRLFTGSRPSARGARGRRAAVVASGSSTDSYFVAANNFKVKQEHAAAFEEVWRTRESRLNECPGFIRFALLRGDEPGEYVSQTHWATRQDFENWTKSQQFSKAHAGVSRKPEAGGGSSGGAASGGKPAMSDMLEGPPRAKFYETATTTERQS